MYQFLERVRQSLQIKAPLDHGFVPMSQFIKMFEESAKKEEYLPVGISIERAGGLITRFSTVCFGDESKYGDLNIFYIERIVKSVIWAYGGFKLTIGAPAYIGRAVKDQYAAGGKRQFDFDFMGTIYERPFSIEATSIENVPFSVASSAPAGRHLDGCRLGFDAGGSDIKVSAVIDGKPIFSKEISWLPKIQTNPQYHLKYIVEAMKLGASYLPRVDAVGISSAGVYINNRAMVASLFMKVPKEVFDTEVKDIYVKAVKSLGGNIPMTVANDGDVTALAGAMELGDTNVLGIAMGTSEAAGFVDANGIITGYLNELAFVPCDLNPDAAVDEWSGDSGCGVGYFSQDAVAKLAPEAGIRFTEGMTPAEKLERVQSLMGKDGSAEGIFQTIGVYLGYGIAFYSRLYDIKHVLILGRVTSGAGGGIILEHANRVLGVEFPELGIKIHLPDESSRRVGQSVAAASLPKIEKRSSS